MLMQPWRWERSRLHGGLCHTLPRHAVPCRHPLRCPLTGVGIVNALEIVRAFPGPDGLQAFKEWLLAPDEQLVELARGSASGGRARGRGGGRGRGGAGGRGRGSSAQQQQEQDEEEEAAGQPGSQEEAQQAALAREFKRRHRGVRRNWEAPPSFPSAAVGQAYANPKVDESKDK